MENNIQKNKNQSRRSFIRRVIYALISIELGYLLFDFLKNKRVEKDNDIWVSIGNTEDFEIEKFYYFSEGSFFFRKQKDGGHIAISQRCTHLGCAVQLDDVEDAFVCPCHASHFDCLGDVESPPALRALDIFPVEIQNGIVKVNISKTIKRDKFDKSQLIYV